jgi:hypothetical protein
LRAGVAGITAGAAAPAGDGVPGAACEVVEDDWVGAAGGAGVNATTGAGVEGTFEDDAAGAGAALGYKMLKREMLFRIEVERTFEIIQTMKPFSSIL